MIIRYSRWDGTQQVAPLDADELMESLSEDLMDDGDLWKALRRMFRGGAENQQGDRMPGLQDLIEQLRRQRQEQLERYNMSSVLQDIQERLEQIVKAEREGIERRVQDGREKIASGEAPEQAAFQKALEKMADQKRGQLDRLPKEPAGQIKELSDYDFMDSDARQQFQDLLDMLKQQMMQQQFQGLQQAIQGMTPQDMQAVRGMLGELNQMLRERAEGGRPDFDGFMQKWGQLFPGAENLDQLVEQLQQSMAQMQSLMDSMSPDQRRQLQEMMDAALQDPQLRQELAELAMNLGDLAPTDDLRRRYSFRGDEPLSLQEAMKLMGDLQGFDRLEKDLRNAVDEADLDAIDAEQLRRLMGDDAGDALEQLKQLRKLLEDAGYIEKRGDKYELTPRAIRKIGQKALRDIFAQLKRDRVGRHDTDHRGTGGDRTDDTKPYEFGDPFLLDLKETVMNAVERRGPGSPVRLHQDDFVVYRTELMTQSSTVLMLDMSRSMILRGCFRAAKKVALALNSLIKGQFPRDNLYIVGFSYYAKELKPESLPQLTWNEWVYGTNMQHGFMLSRQLLARHKGGNRQIIVITDGEPTAHFENGRVEFSYPPTWRTFQETLKEVQRCAREQITVNTFMLERSYSLMSFVEQMTKINRGRAFLSTPDRLGEYILVDYVKQKRRTQRNVS
ncbi:MAG: VWA domain-containing protein [Chloroflexi bacterium]|nr:VWA domain-containing protein [Chloroflexota bacterium]